MMVPGEGVGHGDTQMALGDAFRDDPTARRLCAKPDGNWLTLVSSATH